MKNYYKFLSIVMMLHVGAAKASTIPVEIASNNHQISSPVFLNDLLSIDLISARVIEFLDENTDATTLAISRKPSFIKDEQMTCMLAIKNNHFTRFTNSWMMLHFYTSSFSQLKKYETLSNTTGSTALHEAILSGLKYNNPQLQKMHDAAKTLIFKRILSINNNSAKKRKITIDIHAQTDTGDTAMHYAAAKCDIYAIKKLAQAGAHVNTKNKKGSTPLHYAVGLHDARKMIATIETLVFLGADINAKDNISYTQHNEQFVGRTPLKVIRSVPSFEGKSSVERTLESLGGKL